MRLRLFTLVIVVTVTLSLVGQTFRGGVTGTITDRQEAVVQGAQVKALNAGTGLAYTTSSSSEGVFSFQDLPLGIYTIEINAANFQARRIEGVRVSAGTVYNLPVHVDIAQQATTVEVSAAAVSLDTTTTTQTTIIASRTVQDIPLMAATSRS